MNTTENTDKSTVSSAAPSSTAETNPSPSPSAGEGRGEGAVHSINAHSNFPLPHCPAPERIVEKADFPHFPLNFLKNSTRSNDRLANLPPEDQAQIVHWFALGYTYTKIIHLAAQPRPEGLNLRLSLGVLHRFYHKHDLAEKIATAAELVAELCPENADPQAALEILAETHALHAMAAPDLDHAAFQQLARYLQRQQEYKLRQRALDLREKRAAFEMQHKHFDLFKRTMEALPELNQMLADQSLTPDQRVQRHLDKMFGRECREMIDHANQKWAEQHPEAHHTEPQLDEKDIVPPASKEWDQPAITLAMKIVLGPGLENLFDDSEPATNLKANRADEQT